MTTEVHKHTDRLAIRWTNGAGGEWAVTKRFDPDTRILEPATIDGTFSTRFDSAEEARETATELGYACGLAESMDRVFIRPEDFDLVAVDDQSLTAGYHPALIFPPNHHDGKIYIAIA